MTTTRSLTLALGLALLLAAGSAEAQLLFGKNKVVYTDRRWQVYESGMIHLYFYEEESELARQTLAIAEEAYEDFRAYFDYEFTEPVPVILYGTHHDFKQTHVTPGFVPEGTAGFTEFAKGRVAVRATGDYAELRHLVRHELVHAFMLAKLATVMGDHGIYDFTGPPLWFIEGLAENVADEHPDAQAEMFVRDAVLYGGLYPIEQLWQIQGSFLMYKEGESILGFLRKQYGDDVPALLLENWWRGRHLEEVLEAELGMDLEELSDRWITWLKRRYYPELLTRRSPEEEGRTLLEKGRAETAVAFLPTESASAVHFVCLSAREGTMSLYEGWREGEERERIERRVEGGRSARFESLPAFRSRLDTHDGRWVAFSAKHGGQDAVYVYDLQTGRIATELRFDELREISSPSFSPDGRRVAFSGLSPEGFSDLYVADLATGALRRITHDPYDDLHPDWHPSRDELVFASDRHDPTGGRHTLYRLALSEGARPRLLGDRAGNDLEAVWSPDGEAVLFVSERSGTRNLHLLRGGRLLQLTDVTGGVYSPAWLPGGDAVAASVYHRGRFELYRFELERSAARADAVALQAVADPEPEERPSLPAAEAEAQPRDYEVEMALDFVQSAVALDPDLPYGSGASLGFTDLLGDHQLTAYLSNTSQEFKLDDLNLGVSYSNLARRWNRHVGLFRLNTIQRLTSLRPTRDETRTGGFAGVTYPFSKFQRVELSTVVRHLERRDSFELPGEPGSSVLWSVFASYVHDNSLWTWQGPMRGTRYNLTLGQTFDLRGRGFDRQTLQLDARHYRQLGRRGVLALRWVQRHSFGSDQAVFYVGGPNTLRGYGWSEFFGDRIFLGNVELRLPLVDRLALRFPFGSFDLPNIRGALFFDAAEIRGNVYDTGWIGSFGYSFSLMLLPPVVVRLDVVRPHDFDELDPWEVGWNLSFLF